MLVGMLAIPLWAIALMALGWAVVVALAVMIWSGRSQRPTRIDPDRVEPLPHGLASVEALTASRRSGGNSLEVLQDQAFFDQLLDDIAGAGETIHFESYVWSRGRITERLADALAARARAGVEVRMLLDALGAHKMRRGQIESLRRAGARVVFYHGFSLRSLGRLNKRDHRKLVVFDGRRGYVFGHGIGDEWDHDTRGERAWRDTAARIEGPVVASLQAVFAQGWMSETAEVLTDRRYFPAPAEVGDVAVHVIASSPRGGVSSSSLLYRLMIAAARRELLIQNPYFAPHPKRSSS